MYTPNDFHTNALSFNLHGLTASKPLRMMAALEVVNARKDRAAVRAALVGIEEEGENLLTSKRAIQTSVRPRLDSEAHCRTLEDTDYSV
ncbi:hypothetical protein Tco_1293972 [Tanacetum coccineum]